MSIPVYFPGENALWNPMAAQARRANLAQRNHFSVVTGAKSLQELGVLKRTICCDSREL